VLRGEEEGATEVVVVIKPIEIMGQSETQVVEGGRGGERGGGSGRGKNRQRRRVIRSLFIVEVYATGF